MASNENETAENAEKAKVKRRENIEYISLNWYEEISQARNYIDGEIGLKKCRTRFTLEGMKEEYSCAFNKRGSCPYKLLLFLPNDSRSAQILYAEKHIHDETFVHKSVVQKKILSLSNDRMKPKNILNNIRREMPDANVSLKSIHNLIYRSKNLLTGVTSPCVSLGALCKWLREQSNVPSDIHSSFILNFETPSAMQDELFFRFAVTTKSLLGNALKSHLIHADATYKLNWQGFPLLLFGCTDLQRKFHPISFGCCTSETTEDFTFMFNAIKEGIRTHYSQAFEPKYLMADAAAAIANGAKAVFVQIPEITVIMCFAHVMANLEKQKVDTMDGKIKKEMLADVSSIHRAHDLPTYKKAIQLFLKKYEAHVDFCDYMQKTWFNKYWYQGIRHFTPGTNNALEGTNSVIKRDYTYREREPFEQFKVSLLRIASEMAAKYAEDKPFSYRVDVPIDCWRESLEYLDAEKHRVEHTMNSDSKVVYFVQSLESKLNETQFSKAVSQFDQKSWKKFDW